MARAQHTAASLSQDGADGPLFSVPGGDSSVGIDDQLVRHARREEQAGRVDREAFRPE
jgi:hypothetical protein